MRNWKQIYIMWEWIQIRNLSELTSLHRSLGEPWTEEASKGEENRWEIHHPGKDIVADLQVICKSHYIQPPPPQLWSVNELKSKLETQTSPCCQFSAPLMWPPSNSNLYLEMNKMTSYTLSLCVVPAVNDSDTTDFVVMATLQHLSHGLRSDCPVQCSWCIVFIQFDHHLSNMYITIYLK